MNNNDNAVKEEGQQEMIMDPSRALQKLIRLDRKHTNFDYYDPTKNLCLRVQYPPPADAVNGQHLLKGFWRHISSYYFKQIQPVQYQRLQYLNSIVEVPPQNDAPFKAPYEFWNCLQRTFTHYFINRHQKSYLDSLDHKNWLCILYLNWEEMVNPAKKSKNIALRLRECSQGFKNGSGIQKQKHPQRINHTVLQDNLLLEERMIDKYMPEPQYDNDKISEEINSLEDELKAVTEGNAQLLRKMQARVVKQLSSEGYYECCINTQEDMLDYDRMEQMGADEKIAKRVENIEAVEVQKQYLEYCLKLLEKRQVAESICMVTKMERHRGQPKFTVTFEESMNLKAIQLSQEQFKELNELREYSLLKFYNTSLKSPYSFICQNFIGFKNIVQNRLKRCTLGNEDIMLMMKRSQTRQNEKMNEFEICHQCKLLYPNNMLIQCRYSSKKSGLPIIPPPHYNPYLAQCYKQNNKTHQARNSYVQYKHQSSQDNISDDQYQCGRKYCQHCLRHNYQEGLDANGLCPFCQVICFCTRCSRNDMIVRLRSIYLLLGGDLKFIQDNSYLEQLRKMQAQPNRKPVNSKHIRRSVNVKSKASQKIKNIRFQLEDLRIICDLVKRREKNKLRLVQTQYQIFHKKLQQLAQEGCYIPTLMNDASKQEDQSPLKNGVHTKSKKFQKKLKRMMI